MKLLNDLAETWSTWLLHSGWQAAIVVAAVAVVLQLARRSSAQFRYALLLVALIKFATPPFLSLPVGLFSYAPSPVPLSYRVEATLASEIRDPSDSSVTVPPSPDPTASAAINPSATRSQVSATVHDAGISLQPSVDEPTFGWWLGGLLFLHALGMLAACIRFQHQYREIRQLVRRSSPAPAEITLLARMTAATLKIRSVPAVVISEESDAPFATGIFQPVILLPQSTLELPTDQLQIIIGHELVHIRRWDLIVGGIETVLSIVWWFHPAMWWLQRELRRSREDCCDDVLLATRLTEPEQYCETLIEAAARQTFRPAEPVALGFSNGEHPAARRIRRLMNSSLFRTPRLRTMALLFAVAVGLVVIPGVRPARAPVTAVSLEGLFGGWRNLPFELDEEELALVKECRDVVIQYGSQYETDGRRARRFDEPANRDTLESILKRKPGYFYAEHLLGTWYRRNGDPKRAQELLSAALEHAPIVLTQRYRTGSNEPLAHAVIGEMSIECNRVKNHSLNPELKLDFIDLLTDSDGVLAVPVYDTVYRLFSRRYPVGYDTEMSRLGWFSSQARVGVLPEVTVWKQFSRPRDFTRTAAESSRLTGAKGTTAHKIQSGPNLYRIDRVARGQADGSFVEQLSADPSELPPLPRLTNAGYMDHAIIDFGSPVPDRFEIGELTVLDSQTKIPLQSFQAATGSKATSKTRLHLYSLQNLMPDVVDIVLKVHNSAGNAHRIFIPVAAQGTYQRGNVTFINKYLGAGQHVGWDSKDGFYQDAKDLDFTSEMLCEVVAPSGQRPSLWLVTKDGIRIKLDSFSPLMRIPRPLNEIDHFELVTKEQVETIYFEKIALPPRAGLLSGDWPIATFQLTGQPHSASSDLFSPMILRCQTREGDVYSGIAAGPNSYELHEQNPTERFSESKSTVIVEALGPQGITLSTEYSTRVKAAKIPTAGGGSASGPWGKMEFSTLLVPLGEVDSLKVLLEADSPNY